MECARQNAHSLPSFPLVKSSLNLGRMRLPSGCLKRRQMTIKNKSVSVQMMAQPRRGAAAHTNPILCLFNTIKKTSVACTIIIRRKHCSILSKNQMPFYTIHCAKKKKKEEFSIKLVQFHAQTFGGDANTIRVEFNSLRSSMNGDDVGVRRCVSILFNIPSIFNSVRLMVCLPRAASNQKPKVSLVARN